MDFQKDLLDITDLNERQKFAATLPKDIINDLCEKVPVLNSTICLSEDYWKLRFKKDFPNIEPSISSWKESYMISSNKNLLYASGYNTNGGLGTGDFENKSCPTKVDIVKPKYISSSDTHTVLIDENGDAWGTGDIVGLGIMSLDTELVNFTKLLFKAKQVSCGHQFTLFIGLDDKLYGLGAAANNQLGYNTEIDIVDEPYAIGDFDVKQIASDRDHSLILTKDGHVYGFGRSRPLGLTEDSMATIEPTKMVEFKCKQIACGPDFCAVIDVNDYVWVFGYNENNRLGLPDYEIEEGFFETEPTQLNIKAKQISLSAMFVAFIDLNDFVKTTHPDGHSRTLGVNAKQITTGNEHLVVIDNENSVLTMGYNDYGALMNCNLSSSGTLEKISIQGNYVACGPGSTFVINNESTFLDFETMSKMLSSGKFTTFVFEQHTQIQDKLEKGIFMGTFIDTNNKKYYSLVRYNQQTNQILKP